MRKRNSLDSAAIQPNTKVARETAQSLRSSPKQRKFSPTS